MERDCDSERAIEREREREREREGGRERERERERARNRARVHHSGFTSPPVLTSQNVFFNKFSKVNFPTKPSTCCFDE